MADVARVLDHPTLTNLTLVNLDSTGGDTLVEQPNPFIMTSLTCLTPLARLTLLDCEVEVYWLHHALRKVKTLKSFRASHTHHIWNG